MESYYTESKRGKESYTRKSQIQNIRSESKNKTSNKNNQKKVNQNKINQNKINQNKYKNKKKGKKPKVGYNDAKAIANDEDVKLTPKIITLIGIIIFGVAFAIMLSISAGIVGTTQVTIYSKIYKQVKKSVNPETEETMKNKTKITGEELSSIQERFRNMKWNSDGVNSAQFKMIKKEGEKYLGMPYTYGGTPPYAFDCSGFVGWVYTQVGLANIPRTTAQDIYNMCEYVPMEEAKAGDLIFFTGTYKINRTITHIGIYCGNGIMLDSSNPCIQYEGITKWSNYFYSFGRLPGVNK